MTTTDDNMAVVQTFDEIQEVPEKPQVVNLRQVMNLKRRLSQDDELCFIVDSDITHEDLDSYVDKLLTRMPDGVRRKALFDSIKHVCREDFGNEQLAQLFWHLAGNINKLKAGHAAPPWTRQNQYEWMPMQIVDRVMRRNHKGDPGDLFTCRVLAGSATSFLVTAFWTMSMSRFASQQMGYSKPWGKYPYHDSASYVGMRLYGLFEPELSTNKAPGFKNICVPSGMHDYNRDLIKKRQRIEIACPAGYKHACHRCFIGYDQCPLAVHPRSYVKHACDMCKKTTWFDPDKTTLGLCVSCTDRKAMVRQE